MDSKSRTIKMIAIVAAGMLAAGVLCGCAPFNGKAGEMLRAVTSVNQNKRAEESGTEQEKGEAEKFAIGNADSEDSGGWNGEEKLMKRYEPFGVILHKKDEMCIRDRDFRRWMNICSSSLIPSMKNMRSFWWMLKLI